MELELGFYGARWERATPAQRAYLRAMADEEARASVVTTSGASARMGKRPSDVGALLQRQPLHYGGERQTDES